MINSARGNGWDYWFLIDALLIYCFHYKWGVHQKIIVYGTCFVYQLLVLQFEERLLFIVLLSDVVASRIFSSFTFKRAKTFYPSTPNLRWDTSRIQTSPSRNNSEKFWWLFPRGHSCLGEDHLFTQQINAQKHFSENIFQTSKLLCADSFIWLFN